MAKKRLNKKVALIGSVVFVFLVLVAIGVILHLSRDPEIFIKDGDAAMIIAEEAVDEEIKKEAYQKAERNYLRARARAKSDLLKVEMLFKLVNIYSKTGQWNNILGCWNKIVQLDPKNIEARFGLLQYFYIVADSGGHGYWQEIESQVSEFMEVARDADLLVKDVAKWDRLGTRENVGSEQLGPYLYLLRARAVLEKTRRGAGTDPDESLARAVGDLEKVLELEPGNVDAYWNLAQAALIKGEIVASRGNFEERDKSLERAEELLNKAIELAEGNVKAHINLLKIKLVIAQTAGREQIQSLEPEYLSLVEKFDTSAQAYVLLAGLYQRLGHKYFDNAIAAFEKAIELDKENVTYAINLAELHYRKFSIHGYESEIYKAIEIAKNALALPSAQDEQGPRYWANKINRISLYTFLANCYIEQVLELSDVKTESQTQQWLADAEQMVHEIEQIFGSGEDPQVIRWQGMLELAKGNKDIAIRKLYAAYEQLKASGIKGVQPSYAQLSYALAKIFKTTSEVGAAMEFMTSALSAGIAQIKPEAVLDYAEVCLRLNTWAVALTGINVFEESFGPNERSRGLRIRALIGAKQFDDAEENLAHITSDDPNIVKLNLMLTQAKIRQVQKTIAQRAVKERPDIISDKLLDREEKDVSLQVADEVLTTELNSYKNTFADLVEKLLSREPNFVRVYSVISICNNYVRQGQIERARNLVNQFLESFPDNTIALFHKQLFSMPEPDKVSEQERMQMQENILSNIADPIAKAMSLGVFYKDNDEPKKAVEEFKKVLEATSVREGKAIETDEMINSRRFAVLYLFDIALAMENWEQTEQLIDIAQSENIDGCTGNFFDARLAVAKKEYENALVKLDSCLKQRPVFSRGFMLRSRVHAALGTEHASIKDARKAASLSPLDGMIAKSLALALYQRNQKMGDEVSADQVIETKRFLIEAIRLNPREWLLQSFYAEYISDENPEEALAIRQRLQRFLPSAENALLLGKMAMRIALNETDVEKKELLFNIAASSFEQGLAIEPQNKALFEIKAEYYRLTGQREKAEELLVQSEDKKLLWRHYLRAGRIEDAKEQLEQLYRSDSKDSSVIRGLLIVAERTVDTEAVKKYSEELLLLEDNPENYLIQIRTYLRVGLIKEAEYKLQSFREKYPDESEALMLEAWLVMKQGRLENALKLINQNLQADQDNAAAWRMRGDINRLMANYEQAIIDLKRSKSLSDIAATRITLAKTYLRVGRNEDAITELKNIIEYPEALVEGGTLLEQIYIQLGRKDAVERFHDELLEKFPDNLLWYNRAAAFAATIGKLDRAEKLYKQAWQKSREKGETILDSFDGYLQLLLLKGKFDEVFEEARKYVDSDLAPVAFSRMAEVKMKLGDRENAVKYCQKALDKAGDNEDLASEVLRRIYLLLGAEGVQKSCKERLQANPDSLAANLAMFNLAIMNSEYNKALDYIDKCLLIADPKSQRWVDYALKKTKVLNLAYNKTSDNNYLKKLIVEYESLLTKMPNNATILNNLAYILAEVNVQLNDALRYAERVYKVRPNDAGVLDTYAYVLYRNGKFSEADKFIQAAVQQYEQQNLSVPVDVYKHLGMIKEELGEATQALAAYKQVLETGADTLPEKEKEQINVAIERLSQQNERNESLKLQEQEHGW